MQGQEGRSPEQRELDLLKEEVAKMNNLRAYHPMEAANPAYTFPKDANRIRDETPDHLSVSGCIVMLTSDMRQLMEELGELRARLSPILYEQKAPPIEKRVSTTPVHCRMAAELVEVDDMLKAARENVYSMLAQLDL